MASKCHKKVVLLFSLPGGSSCEQSVISRHRVVGTNRTGKHQLSSLLSIFPSQHFFFFILIQPTLPNNHPTQVFFLRHVRINPSTQILVAYLQLCVQLNVLHPVAALRQNYYISWEMSWTSHLKSAARTKSGVFSNSLNASWRIILSKDQKSILRGFDIHRDAEHDLRPCLKQLWDIPWFQAPTTANNTE